MRRIEVVLLIFLVGCRGLGLGSQSPSPALLATEPPSFSETGSLSPSPAPSPSLTASPVPLDLSLAPYPLLTASPALPPEATFSVFFHPDGGLYVGDQVSMEVVALSEEAGKDKKVYIEMDGRPPNGLGSASFGPYGIGRRLQATFMWAWDTRGLEPGDYNLLFFVVPDGSTWTETVRLLPGVQVPPPEILAHWESAESECCVVHYITGTDGARDLPDLLMQADQEAQEAIQSMGIEFGEPISITLLPRVLGHGGFAGEEIYISYLDRNYTSTNYSLVLHHEMIHILDARLGGDLRPPLLQEGLAVYLSGGHFKPEPLFPRAAALLSLGWYLPLASLADDFYTSQHEIGYLEAGALVQHMVRTWGREAFEDFYRDIKPDSSGKQSQAIDDGLQKHFGITFSDLERQFQATLRRQKVDPDLKADLRLTVAYFDTVRRYQKLLDPSAYFLTAWLPEGDQMRERGIVADYLRRPTSPETLLVESLLTEAYTDLRARNYSAAMSTLSFINQTLNQSGREASKPVVLPTLETGTDLWIFQR